MNLRSHFAPPKSAQIPTNYISKRRKLIQLSFREETRWWRDKKSAVSQAMPRPLHTARRIKPVKESSMAQTTESSFSALI